MTSQMGSRPRVVRSAPDNDRSFVTGAVRSAILTYFGQFVIREWVATKGSYPQLRLERIAPAAQARSHGRPNHTGCRPATQKQKRKARPPAPDDGSRRNRHGRTTI